MVSENSNVQIREDSSMTKFYVGLFCGAIFTVGAVWAGNTIAKKLDNVITQINYDEDVVKIKQEPVRATRVPALPIYNDEPVPTHHEPAPYAYKRK